MTHAVGTRRSGRTAERGSSGHRGGRPRPSGVAVRSLAGRGRARGRRSTCCTKQLALTTSSDGSPVRLLGGAGLLRPDPQQRGGVQHRHRLHLRLPAHRDRRGRLASSGCARRLRSLPWALALGLVLGGALGNLIDRLFRAPGPLRGHVVDFISVFAPDGRALPDLQRGRLGAVLRRGAGDPAGVHRPAPRRHPAAPSAGRTGVEPVQAEVRDSTVTRPERPAARCSRCPTASTALRLDQAVSRLFGLSRTVAAALVEAGDVLVDGVAPGRSRRRSAPAPGWR